MRIEIFDVEHGQCAMVHCPNGKKIMVDTGHNASAPWYPSAHFKGIAIECLIHTNLDEDHASDYANVERNCSIRGVIHNPTIGSRELYAMKSQNGMGNGIHTIYEWLKRFEREGGPISIDLGDVKISWFCNSYTDFKDTNNLSIATFVSYSNFTILFPGDLEDAGWMKLLEQAEFRECLSKVTVLVASHHGRENGCCDEIFNYCSPTAVIISDAGKQYSTQETQNWYANRVLGYKEGDIIRKVLTTRQMGTITIDVDCNGFGTVTTQKYNTDRTFA